MDRLEEIRIKNCAFLTHSEKDWLISEIERLRKEKEWLINEVAVEKFYGDELRQSEIKKLMARMQQALKEK